MLTLPNMRVNMIHQDLGFELFAAVGYFSQYLSLCQQPNAIDLALLRMGRTGVV